MNVFDRVKKIQNLNRAVNTKELVEESRNFIKYDQPSLWDYSKEYLGIASEGLRKPPPSFGSPTFIWHLGVWQRWIDPGQNDKSKNLNHKITSFEQCNEIFFQDISRFVNLIQERGRILGLPTEKLNFESPDYLPGITKQFGDADHPDNQDMNYEHIFKVCEPQSVSFTLWWVDEDENGKSIQNTRLIKPEYSALRVRVQVQTHIDHATLSFFIDAAKPYNSGQIYQTPKIAGNKRADFGRRRDKVANHLDIVRRIAREQVSSGAIERDRIPEMNVTADDAKRLREAADYFYDGIWQEFKTSFGIVRDQLSPDQNNEGVTFAGRMGRIFADIRGVMMSSDWIVSEEQKAANRSRVDKARKSANMPEGFISREREANVGIGSFDFFEKAELNTALKSMWPFLRRSNSWADYKDVVGCGIIEGRALYATTLGSSEQFYSGEEFAKRENADDAEVPKGCLPDQEPGWQAIKERPIRYLVLTKGEPHREQIGRFVERINAIATMRLFAFKSLPTIKNAGYLIRLIGRELDLRLAAWAQERREIEAKYQERMKNLYYGWMWLRRLFGNVPDKSFKDEDIDYSVLVREKLRTTDKIITKQEEKIEEERIYALNRLISQTDAKIIELGARLDKIGHGGSGRILYVINRSNYHSKEFERLVDTLEIINVEGWINYKQFVERSMKPTFNMIRNTGERLAALRTRLQVVTDTIQTSALIIETAATRSNTQMLRKLATRVYWAAGLGVTAIIFREEIKNNLFSWIPWISIADIGDLFFKIFGFFG